MTTRGGGRPRLPARPSCSTGYPGRGSVTGRCLVERGLAEDPITPELRDSPVPGPDWLPRTALLGVMAGLSMFRTSAFRQVGGFSGRMWLEVGKCCLFLQ
jgi:hypothetical protein